ncbi:MAG: PAS domain-containing protein [Desulfosarcina sp.]
MSMFPGVHHSLTTRIGGALGIVVLVTMGTWVLLLWYWGFAMVSLLAALLGLTLLSAVAIVSMVFLINRWVALPIRRLVDASRMLAQGEPIPKLQVATSDDLGRLGEALLQISQVLDNKRSDLLQEHGEHLNLFESVPCLITVQDRDLRLVRYNRAFAEKFAPRDGDFCYSAYKGRSVKCEQCPVEKTFRDGKSHSFEESGFNRDGQPIRWFARTAPIRDADGNVVAAMEMSLDVTLSRQLEEKLKASEERYQAIFSNIPNPVFVLDPKTMRILDCNDSVKPVYGYRQEELKNRSFLELFESRERDQYAAKIKGKAFIHQARQFNHEGKPLFVDIRASLTPYPEWEVLLVTTSDITQQIETEQQLIQASKMTTLGEMATGVAHELNQPLSVMKTASSFLLKKFATGQAVNPEIFENMLQKIDSNVDRATNIIQHMRQFARKSKVELEPVDINHTLQMALEIFSEQLKVRGIQVEKQITAGLPHIQGNPSLLEQVFINLLLNARDAIEEKWDGNSAGSADKTISLITRGEAGFVVAKVCDTGTGIPASAMNKIFEPFFTTKTVGKGTGLGLSISYAIVRQCGGTIQANNRDAGGACFTIRFPVPVGV